MQDGSTADPVPLVDWRSELRALAAIAVPNALTAAARSAVDLSNTAVLGRLRDASGQTTALYLDCMAHIDAMEKKSRTGAQL